MPCSGCSDLHGVNPNNKKKNSDNPSLLDLVMTSNDDLIDFSVLSLLGKSDHSTVEVLAKVFIK